MPRQTWRCPHPDLWSQLVSWVCLKQFARVTNYAPEYLPGKYYIIHTLLWIDLNCLYRRLSVSTAKVQRCLILRALLSSSSYSIRLLRMECNNNSAIQISQQVAILPPQTCHVEEDQLNNRCLEIRWTLAIIVEIVKGNKTRTPQLQINLTGMCVTFAKIIPRKKFSITASIATLHQSAPNVSFMALIVAMESVYWRKHTLRFARLWMS